MGHVLDNSQQSNGHLHADLIRADAIECSSQRVWTRCEFFINIFREKDIDQ